MVATRFPSAFAAILPTIVLLGLLIVPTGVLASPLFAGQIGRLGPKVSQDPDAVPLGLAAYPADSVHLPSAWKRFLKIETENQAAGRTGSASGEGSSRSLQSYEAVYDELQRHHREEEERFGQALEALNNGFRGEVQGILMNIRHGWTHVTMDEVIDNLAQLKRLFLQELWRLRRRGLILQSAIERGQRRTLVDQYLSEFSRLEAFYNTIQSWLLAEWKHDSELMHDPRSREAMLPLLVFWTADMFDRRTGDLKPQANRRNLQLGQRFAMNREIGLMAEGSMEMREDLLRRQREALRDASR